MRAIERGERPSALPVVGVRRPESDSLPGAGSIDRARHVRRHVTSARHLEISRAYSNRPAPPVRSSCIASRICMRRRNSLCPDTVEAVLIDAMPSSRPGRWLRANVIGNQRLVAVARGAPMRARIDATVSRRRSVRRHRLTVAWAALNGNRCHRNDVEAARNRRIVVSQSSPALYLEAAADEFDCRIDRLHRGGKRFHRRAVVFGVYPQRPADSYSFITLRSVEVGSSRCRVLTP